MKYCRVCKLRAKESETVCARCGGELTLLGTTLPAAGASTSDGGVAAAPTLALRGAIRDLEQAQQANIRRGRVLLAICAGALALLLFVVYEVYASTVLSYAVLENVEISQDPVSDSTVHVSFHVIKPGRVAFDRISGDRHTEKRDEYAQAGPVSLSWTWPSDKQTGIDFNVIYRSGLTRSYEQRHFDVTGVTRSVDVVFLLDTTGSMNDYIKGLQEKCIAFASVVQSKGFDCRLGLIGFGDVQYKEPLFVLDPTNDISRFQTAVKDVPRNDGHDFPESSVEAMEKALTMPFRPKARVCFVLITDANCHNEGRIPGLVAQLTERKIPTFVVAPIEWQNLYGPLCVNRGKFYSLNNADFAESLLKVAGTIAAQISSN